MTEELLEKVNINDSIMELRAKFLKIKSMGYVKSVRNGSTGIGATFEALIGKEEDKEVLPDFKGIEIKTRRGYSKSLINLFNFNPKGETSNELKRIRDKYGYPDKNDMSLKRFSAYISSDDKVKVGLFYKFKIVVSREKQKIILCVYDWNDVCIDDSSYWDFATLEEKLYKKLNVLALIKAWPNRLKDGEYFKYYKMNIYILKDFESFISAIEKGLIKICFKIGNCYDEERYGEVEGHGVGFAIEEADLDEVFDIYR